MCDTADPWGGSYFIERLTQDLITKAQGHIDEISALGGMPKAIAQGLPKLRIEESSAKTQARIDSARQVIVGVNKHVCNDDDVPDVLVVDNAQVHAHRYWDYSSVRLAASSCRHLTTIPGKYFATIFCRQSIHH